MQNSKQVVILIAEDDDGHAELITEGLKDSGLKNKMVRFRDGQELWDFLVQKKAQRNNGMHYLLLLDIKMPKIDGVEILRLMKADPKLKDIPAIMLTTTDDPREVENCYALGCSVYITKPIDFTLFAEKLKRLGLFIQIIKV